jgi:hypothetical protein
MCWAETTRLAARKVHRRALPSRQPSRHAPPPRKTMIAIELRPPQANPGRNPTQNRPDWTSRLRARRCLSRPDRVTRTAPPPSRFRDPCKLASRAGLEPQSGMPRLVAVFSGSPPNLINCERRRPRFAPPGEVRGCSVASCARRKVLGLDHPATLLKHIKPIGAQVLPPIHRP